MVFLKDLGYCRKETTRAPDFPDTLGSINPALKLIDCETYKYVLGVVDNNWHMLLCFCWFVCVLLFIMSVYPREFFFFFFFALMFVELVFITGNSIKKFETSNQD